MDNAAGSLTPWETSWGDLSLTLRLPSLKVKLLGLSCTQHKTLKESYSNFISQKVEFADIHCIAYRLQSMPDIHIEQLSSEGQYAPKKVRSNDASTLTVTGDNFEAHFEMNTSTSSSLGVLKEKELTHANVIENYLRIISAHRVLRQNGVVLHSAGLVFNEKAYIFSGRSNAGKTTLTRKAYAKGALVLSDDINLVLPVKTGYDAYAVPFTGEFGRTLDHAGGKKSYPLAGIVLLEQSDHLQTLPVGNAMAVARLLTGCPFVNTDEHESEALFDSVTALVENVPVIRLLNQRTNSIDDIMAAVHKQFSKS